MSLGEKAVHGLFWGYGTFVIERFASLAITIVLAVVSLLLAGGSGPLYAFMAIVGASGVVLLLLTFRIGPDEALEATSYDDGGTEAPTDDVPGPTDV